MREWKHSVAGTDREGRRGACPRPREADDMSEVKPQHREPKSRSGPSSGSFKLARVEVQELAALAGPEVMSGPGPDLLSDELLIDRVLAGQLDHYEILMRRASPRLYRIARGIDSNASDA